MSQPRPIPATPRVISPSPTPSESGDATGNYFAPITRSAAKRANTSSSIPISEENDFDSDPDQRARARSRSPHASMRRRRPSGIIPGKSKATGGDSAVKKSEPIVPNGTTSTTSNGHLSPASAAKSSISYWRDFSRSPSPLGLIPIHRHWRSFVHRHEIPRKFLHVSIGFFTIYLYASGLEVSAIHPWLLVGLVPIALLDILRHRSARFNRLYVRVCGALMRESEVNDRYNGVIFYLAGAWAALFFYPKDIAVMSILLLSWCDTAASTFGRLYGRYTIRLRKGKSLAGSIAAAIVGGATAWLFWGLMAPRFWGYENSFMFKGSLRFPDTARQILRLPSTSAPQLSGSGALAVISIWSGLVASVSEFVDLFGLDDNLTIPVLSGMGLWLFLRIFG